MGKRYIDALVIQQGACNVSGLAYSILDASQEIRQEDGLLAYNNLIDECENAPKVGQSNTGILWRNFSCT